MRSITRSGVLLVLLSVTAGFTNAQTPALHAPRVAELADAMESKVIAWRRDIHQNPELGNREFRTSKLVADHLRGLGLEVKTGVAHTGAMDIHAQQCRRIEVALRVGRGGPAEHRRRVEHHGHPVGHDRVVLGVAGRAVLVHLSGHGIGHAMRQVDAGIPEANPRVGRREAHLRAGVEVVGPKREVYLDDGRGDGESVTEIQFPIAADPGDVH